MGKVVPAAMPKLKPPPPGIAGRPPVAVKPPPAIPVAEKPVQKAKPKSKLKQQKPPGPPAITLSPAEARNVINSAEAIGALPVADADVGEAPPDVPPAEPQKRGTEQ